MRSLLLCSPLFAPSRGGSQKLFADLADLWIAEGGRAVVYSGAHGPAPVAADTQGERLTVRRFPIRVLGAGGLRGKLLGAAARIGPAGWRAALGFPHFDSPTYRRYLRVQAMTSDGPPDLVVAGVLPHTHFMAPAAAFACRHGIPWIAVPLLHSGLMDRHPLHHVTGSAAATVLASASQVIALSKAEIPHLLRLGIPAGRLRVLPAALMEAAPPAATLSAAERPDIPGPFYLQAGAIAADKGTLTLLDAHTRRVECGAQEYLVLAGTPRPEVERQLAGLAPAVRRHTLLLREPTDEVLYHLMSRARAVVQPGRADSFGLVLLEAWRAGTPVVVADAGGPPHLVHHGEDGLIFEIDDAEALAGSLDRLLADAASARALGTRGQERLRADYTWSNVYPRWRQVFFRAMGEHDAGAAA